MIIKKLRDIRHRYGHTFGKLKYIHLPCIRAYARASGARDSKGLCVHRDNTRENQRHVSTLSLGELIHMFIEHNHAQVGPAYIFAGDAPDTGRDRHRIDTVCIHRNIQCD